MPVRHEPRAEVSPLSPINGDDYYPPRCGTVPQTGQAFCIHYRPLKGFYEIPPAGVPADMARVDPSINPPPPYALNVTLARYAGFAAVSTLAAALIFWLAARRRSDATGEKPL